MVKNHQSYSKIIQIKVFAFIKYLLLSIVSQWKKFKNTIQNCISQLKKRHKNTERRDRSAGFQDSDGINLNLYFSNNCSSSSRKVVVPQVDFTLFYQQFWPTVAPRTKNQEDPLALPSLVWTQIYSYIKGSQYSYYYNNHCLPLAMYKEKVSGYFSEDLIVSIYDYFQKYQQWKENQMYFDLLDIVNNLIYFIEQRQWEQFPIHYLYIDEVQDLPTAIIELFCRITEQKVFFCGDTAQCILKGIGFRFQDLQQIFKNSKKVGANQLEKFEMFQLTTNFRSHNSILQFANCIVTMLEQLFPKSLDHLKKEISNLRGPKPVIITVPYYQTIFDQLSQDSYSEEFCEVEFGSSQVIIVKNEEAKYSLPKIFSDSQILTIFQAKGLEYEDVVLYNLFTSDPISDNQWNLLACLDVEDVQIDSEIFNLKITKHQNVAQNKLTEQTSDGTVTIKKLKLNDKILKHDINDFSSLCNELKALYVCITRAKKRIIIYDDQPNKRRQLDNLLPLMDVCEFCSDEPRMLGNYVMKSKQSNTTYLTAEQKAEWEYQGQQLYNRKIYEEEAKCFKKSGNHIMQNLASAYSLAKKALDKKSTYKMLKYQQRASNNVLLKNKILEFRDIFTSCFYQAALKFHQISYQKQIAIILVNIMIKVFSFIQRKICYTKQQNALENWNNIYQQSFFIYNLKS